MNSALIRRAIKKCDREIIDYQNQLETMQPAFLYDYEIIQKLDDVLRETIMILDMLTEILEGQNE